MFWLEAFRLHFKVIHGQSTILARGGGNATAAGVDFQAKLGAWLASQLLAERPLDARLTGKRLRSLRFETDALFGAEAVSSPCDQIRYEFRCSHGLPSQMNCSGKVTHFVT